MTLIAMTIDGRNRHWGLAWLVLVIAIAVHVVDEAATGFLPLYNSTVASLRDSYPWFPLPTFSFSVWIAGLAIAVLVLLALSPLVFAGNRYLRPIAFLLGVLMILNGLGHIGGSIYLGALAPGAMSSPVLLLTAIALLITTYRVR